MSLRIKSYETEKPNYDKKKEELRKQLLKEEVELPKIKMRAMSDYLDTVYGNKKDESKKLAEVSLRHWQQYLLLRENPNQDVGIRDITRFISSLKNQGKSSSTIADYLGQLATYFYHENQEDFADYAKEQGKQFQKITKKDSKNLMPIRVQELKKLYQSSELEDKVLIRLLLFETIPIDNLAKIFVIQDSNGRYHFNDGEKNMINLDEETVKVAVPLIQSNDSKNDNKLLSFQSGRTIETHIAELSKKIGGERIYAKTLRKFGRNIHHDDLIEWLSTTSQSIT